METAEAPPVAGEARLFRGSGTIGGHEMSGNRHAATVGEAVTEKMQLLLWHCQSCTFASAGSFQPPIFFFFVLPKKKKMRRWAVEKKKDARWVLVDGLVRHTKCGIRRTAGASRLDFLLFPLPLTQMMINLLESYLPSDGQRPRVDRL